MGKKTGWRSLPVYRERGPRSGERVLNNTPNGKNTQSSLVIKHPLTSIAGPLPL